MPKEAELTGKKALSLCLLRVLEKYATPARPLTTRALMEYMQADYGLEFERKAVGRNLILLTEMGFPLSTYQENGRGYYLIGEDIQSLHWQDEDKRLLLLDALLRAPRYDQSETLLAECQGEVPIFEWSETLLPTLLLENIAQLRGAIAAGQQIRFENAGIYANAEGSATTTSATPYALAFAEGQYYVLLSMAGYGKLLHQRCDQMRRIEVTELPARPVTELSGCEGGLPLREYVLQNLYRAGPEESYVLLCKRHLRDEVYAAFGTRSYCEAEGEYLRVTLHCRWPQMRRFLLDHLKYASLLAPQASAAAFAEELRQAAACYPN
ncbi:MAG: WYL domain-containing protein [Clostridiales bacterium]|nr:WYL domain-containing protein [Clostridiales bacterium]